MRVASLLSRLHPHRLKSWWRSLPPQKRIQWIASIILIFAGAEALVVAPAILELAVLIDAFGLLFVLAAAKNYLGAYIPALGFYARKILAAATSAVRAVEAVSNLGMKLPSPWLLRYLNARTLMARTTLTATTVTFLALALQYASKKMGA